MATSTVSGIAIRSVAGAVPAKIRTNQDIGGPDQAEYVNKMSETVGVVERRVVAPGQFGSDLALAAAKSVLAQLEWDSQSIDLLVVATQTPDRLFPGESFQLHRALGLPQSCVVFDINLGCSAFTHGLWSVASLLPTVGRRALLINVDTMSRTLGADDYGNQVLFGDGATATALEVDHAAPTMSFVLTSDGKGTESVCYPNSAMSATPSVTPEFVINGPAVLGLALRSVPKIIDQLLDQSGLDQKEIGLVVPHQANVFILDKLCSRLELEPSRFLVSMEKFGNTSSCSIPLALCARPDVVVGADREHVMMVGFGTGFSLSGVIADLRDTTFVVPAEVG